MTTQLITSTLQEQSGEVADEVLGHHPLTMLLKEKGKIEEFTGGYEIRKAVLYNTTAVGGFYTGLDVFNMDASEDLTYFKFNIRQLYEPYIISGREMRANTGDAQIVNLADQKYKATKHRLKNTFSASILSDGTGYGGLGFDGIQLAVASSPTAGTYGGITRSGNTFSQNVSTTGVGLTAANIQSNMTNSILTVTRGTEMPDCALLTRAAYKLLHDSMTAIQRITNESRNGKAGFSKSLMYDGLECWFDGGFPSGTGTLTGTTVRILNTNYLSFDVESQANFVPLSSKEVRPVDQDGYTNVILCEGNLCCSAPLMQAYLD